jgi:2-polyprenyl-3-methyl-5-hydroxy-6-metoxy-1,4-benzoquinol methylase
LQGFGVELYPGLQFIQVQPDRPLPFRDKEFDIVFSNAVIEHVGNTEQQCAFVTEACRVGRRVFITTSNRWFPIEHHTSVPLLHYLPKSVYREILRHTALKYWSDERNLNLLTLAEFRSLFSDLTHVVVEREGLGMGFFMSNLVAYLRKD